MHNNVLIFILQRVNTWTHLSHTILSIKVIIVDIRSLLYALVNVLLPDWLMHSNFRLQVSDNLHTDSHQNLLISTSKIKPRLQQNLNLADYFAE